VGGYEDEVTKLVPYKLIEYTAAEVSTRYFKARIVFKPEGESSCRIIWTIFWTPDSAMVGMLIALGMRGFCNLALYRLEQRAVDNKTSFAEEGADEEEGKHACIVYRLR
jgi:hypothetical protein